MDRNQVIGLVLISAILIGYLQFFAPEPVEEPQAVTTTENVSDSTSNTQVVQNKVEQIPDSIQDVINQSKYGVFSTALNGNEKQIKVENNTSIFTFSTKGATLKSVELKDYKTYGGESLILFDEGSHREELNVQLISGEELNINELYFNSNVNDLEIREGNKSQKITFTAELSNGKSIQKTYEISPNKYEIGFTTKFNSLDKELASNEVSYQISDNGKHFEKDIKQSRYRSLVTYMDDEGDFDDFGERSLDNFDETLNNIKWFSFKQKFFSKVYVFEKPLKEAKITLSPNQSSDDFTKNYFSSFTVDKNDLNSTIYYGPNKYDILSDVGFELEKNVYLGWSLFRVVNEYLILPLFNFLSSLFGSMGIVIFLLVLVIKTVIFPFTFKSYKGFAKMRVLKPELDALKEKCGDDQTKYQQEQMKVYQKFGVSPLSGCIPLLFQMPFLLALFQLFPNSIELRGKSFLWAEDLSTYDAFFSWGAEIPLLGSHLSLFTLLMTTSTIAYTYISQQMTPTATAPGQPNMKFMSYMMPLVFFFMLNDYASGLTYYYFLSNLITIGQQLISKKFIDEDKILAKMQEYSKKDNKKKSSFSKRLEEAMKAQQEKQKGKK